MSPRPLVSWLASRLDEPVRTWFLDSVAVAEQGPGEAFGQRWSGCGRRLGREVLEVGPADVSVLEAAGAPFLPGGWGRDELGRVLLLLTAAGRAAPEAVPTLVGSIFRTGELREQQAVLKALAHLPGPERFKDLAAEAVRTNAVSVLEAIACENPYPAAHLPDLAFNQLVMKAIFNGLALRRVVGLAGRRNDELSRMVGAFASERRAAGRPVPADLDLVSG